MTELEVYMVTHKSVPTPSDPYYVPIQAGAALGPNLGILRDDTGKNISERNPFYSELTAHYWILNNSRASAIGLVHYRRFFDSRTGHFDYCGLNVASGLDLLEALKTHNLIVIRPTTFYNGSTGVPRSLEQQYVDDHDGFDLVTARRVIQQASPEYLPAFDFVMRSNKLIPFNLMVCTRERFQAYHHWLFDVCFKIENAVQQRGTYGYQARILAFLSERLFTTWVAHNRPSLSLSYRDYLFVDET